MKTILSCSLLFFSLITFGQKLNPLKVNKLIASKFSRQDIGYLWVSPDTDFAQVGFVGENYERFRIHFASVIKDKRHKNQYIAQGKTKVKNNICDFQGTITIDTVDGSMSYPDVVDSTKVLFAVIKGSYSLKEDPRQKHSGVFNGRFYMRICVDSSYHIVYDDLMEADNYSNNHFNGYWSSYDGKTQKVCNWGDGRVDNCGDLDWGVGDFIVNVKYLKNGWEGSNWRSTIEEMDKYCKDKSRSQWWK